MECLNYLLDAHIRIAKHILCLCDNIGVYPVRGRPASGLLDQLGQVFGGHTHLPRIETYIPVHGMVPGDELEETVERSPAPGRSVCGRTVMRRTAIAGIYSGCKIEYRRQQLTYTLPLVRHGRCQQAVSQFQIGSRRLFLLRHKFRTGIVYQTHALRKKSVYIHVYT